MVDASIARAPNVLTFTSIVTQLPYLIGYFDSYNVWIGLRPLPDGSGYQWLDGSQTTYLPWAGGGEPDVRFI